VKSKIIYRELAPEREAAFVDRGYAKKYVFAHKSYCIPKPGPDAVSLERRMLGNQRTMKHLTLTLHATGETLSGFPDDLLFDKSLVIHQQHFGVPGHVAYANLTSSGKDLYALQIVGDPIQRRTRAKTYSERLRRGFRGWRQMIVNSMIDLALARGIDRLRLPKAEFVMQFTDPKRTVSKELFKRVYDDTVTEHFDVVSEPDWWLLDMRANRERVVRLETKREARIRPKIICISHDIERGIGHRQADPTFATEADRHAPGYLNDMLAVERELGCQATYCAVGSILPEIRGDIERLGHCLAFHSFDHKPHPKRLWHKLHLPYLRNRILSRIGNYPTAVQLKLCRKVDYFLRGYRPPNSMITPELSNENLRFFNFDWLASSVESLGITAPRFRDGVALIPIHFDDFPLYRGDCSYADWEARALSTIERNDFTAFGLHDCYAAHWLPHYRSFLERVTTMGKLMTFDAVANDVFLEQCQ